MQLSLPILRRVALFIALSPVVGAAQNARTPFPQDTVLFVCEHGTVKSLLAKLEFEQQAAAAGLSMAAVSRGSAVDSAVPPWMRTALAKEGKDLGDWVPRGLQPTDLRSAALVVSFDLPSDVTAGARAPRAQWDGLPSVSANFSEGHAAIRERVRVLVDSLKRRRQ